MISLQVITVLAYNRLSIGSHRSATATRFAEHEKIHVSSCLPDSEVNEKFNYIPCFQNYFFTITLFPYPSFKYR